MCLLFLVVIASIEQYFTRYRSPEQTDFFKLFR